MRLILHTGAYWLLLDLRAAIPSWNPLRHTEFATIRLHLLKIGRRLAFCDRNPQVQRRWRDRE
jgi:Transposase DDE domain group 1